MSPDTLVSASERQWLVNDRGAKHDLLRGSLCWGHMRSLTFMISQQRAYSFSECETLLVELLGNLQRFPKETSSSPSHTKAKNTEGSPCVSNSQYGLPLLDGWKLQ